MKHLGGLESTQQARVALGYASTTVMHLSCSPNFPRASYLDERTLMYEPIVNWDKKQDNIKRNVVHQDYISGRLRAPDPHT